MKRPNFSHASFIGLYLLGTHCPGLFVNGLRLERDLHLRKGFVANGEVDLRGAAVGGQLVCDDGSFLNKDGTALNANGITVNASVILRCGFRAEGEVNLLRAFIGGHLSCIGGSFLNEKKTALNADSITVTGSVFLRDEFNAEGEVNFRQASIGGQLACSGGSFLNECGTALCADAITVTSSVYLDDKFRAEGEVNLVGATIGGQLSCSGGSFLNEDGRALNANAISVTASVFLGKKFMAKGEVNLCGASIEGQLDCSGGSFLNEGKTALAAAVITVHGDVFLRAQKAEGEVEQPVNCRIEGELDFGHASIRGSFQYRDVDDPEKATLNLRHARAHVFMDDPKSWPVAGNLLIRGFEYENLDDRTTVDAEQRIDWLSRDGGDGFNPQPYEQLAKVLSRSGHRSEARAIRVEKERRLAKQERQRREYRSWRKIFGLGRWCWDFLYGGQTDYGYRPWKVWRLSVAIILAGWPLYEVGYAWELITPTRVQSNVAPYDDGPAVYPTFQGLAYSIDAFVPLVNIEQVDYWLPNAARGPRWDWPGRYYVSWSGGLLFFYYCQVASGWVLTTLLVVGLTRLVQRED